ncbi:MAG: glycogen/starch synthase, partial [Limisphaerales bacterium]
MQVAGECFPYSKTGGLADMVGALTKALAHQGHELTLVTPLYRGMESWL